MKLALPSWLGRRRSGQWQTAGGRGSLLSATPTRGQATRRSIGQHRVGQRRSSYRSAALRLLMMLALLVGSSSVLAKPRDKAANKKVDEAINQHYLATNFKKAEGVLLGTIRACEDKCSEAVLARAWMYVGIVRGSARGNIGSAQEAFVEALTHDPGVKFDDALATPEVQSVWKEAKASFGAGAGPAETEAIEEDVALDEAEDGSGDAVSADAGPAAAGNMQCIPEISELQSRRPFPISCTTDAAADRAQIYYKEFGSPSWDRVSMGRSGSSWTGSIPCSATELIGKLHWYVQAEKAGKAADSYGTKQQPLRVHIVETTSEQPPAYPGKPAPARCAEAAECPADMIGTPACEGGNAGGQGARGWGEACSGTAECESGLYCINGTCDSPPGCEMDSDCESGLCEGSVCSMEGLEESSYDDSAVPKNRMGLHFVMDVINSPELQNVCAPQSPDAENVDCFEGGYTYPFPDNPNQQGFTAGNIPSGFATGTVRLLLSFERLIAGGFALEGLAGFAFGGALSDFQPLHGELRAKYWLGELDKPGLRAMLYAGGGAGEFDAAHTVDVVDSAGAFSPVAYSRYGTALAGGGGGLMYALNPKFGLHFSVGGVMTFPASAIVVQPSLGASLGF